VPSIVNIELAIPRNFAFIDNVFGSTGGQGFSEMDFCFAFVVWRFGWESVVNGMEQQARIALDNCRFSVAPVYNKVMNEHCADILAKLMRFTVNLPDNEVGTVGRDKLASRKINAPLQLSALPYGDNHKKYISTSEDYGKYSDDELAALFARRVMEPIAIFLTGLAIAVLGIFLQISGHTFVGALLITVGVFGTMILGWLWGLWIV
jgi:hypothetical protein